MDINDYLEFKKLGTTKNYDQLVAGEPGYVSNEGGKLRAVLQPADAKFIAYLEFQPGETRGYEYHKFKTEYLVMIRGTLKALYYLPNDRDMQLETTLTPGDFVVIKPGCVHAYTSEDGSAVAIEYSPDKFDRTDIYKSSP